MTKVMRDNADHQKPKRQNSIAKLFSEREQLHKTIALS